MNPKQKTKLTNLIITFINTEKLPQLIKAEINLEFKNKTETFIIEEHQTNSINKSQWEQLWLDL